MCCGSFVSKFWNRQKASAVPDPEIQIESSIWQNRNNRYQHRKGQLFNELRNVRNAEVLPANSVLPIALVQRVVTVITVFYTLSKRNAQIAGQHLRAVSDLGVGCSLPCRCFVVLSALAANS